VSYLAIIYVAHKLLMHYRTLENFASFWPHEGHSVMVARVASAGNSGRSV
jgi:transposase